MITLKELGARHKMEPRRLRRHPALARSARQRCGSEWQRRRCVPEELPDVIKQLPHRNYVSPAVSRLGSKLCLLS